MPSTMRVEAIEQKALSSLWKISINSQYVCYAITPPVRGEGIKVYGETAIGAGMYDCFTRISPTPGRGEVIELKSVENFQYIQFHVGNFFWDTDGCFCVGVEPKPLNCEVTPPHWARKFLPDDFEFSSHMVSDSKQTHRDLLKIFKFKNVKKCHVVI